MDEHIILTIIGTDRPRLVETLAKTVKHNGGNWLDSRMSHLGGYFAGVLHVSVPSESQADLVHAFVMLEEQGLRTVFHIDSSAPALSPPQSVLPRFNFSVIGPDRSGIVQELTQVLSEFHGNIEEIQTSSETAPMTGGLLFRANLSVSFSETVDQQFLTEQLQRIAHDLGLEIDFRHG